MKKNILLFCFLLPCLMSYAEKHATEVKPLDGERWYGAYAAKAFAGTPFKDITFQPYLADEKRKDLRVDNRGNQAAPLLLSSKGRYVWSDEPFAFELKGGTLLLYSDHEQMEPIAAGKTLREAYLAAMRKHFPASGKTPNPLMFKMPQYNTWIELGTEQNQKDIIKYADDVIRNGFPTGVFMIDDKWSNHYGNFEFNPVAFPDPKGMVDYLHTKGFRVMLWLTPFVSPDSKEFKHLLRQKALVLRADNRTPALIKWWNGYSACLDLTKPVAVDWLRTQLKSLQTRYGIDGFKFDAGDFDFYHKGSRVFPNDDTNTTGQQQAEAFGKLGTEFDFNEFRAAWKNGNQPLAQRLQDKGYSWDELKLLVPDMISAGLIGHPFTCPDLIGGGLIQTFENIDYGKFDQALLIRSAQVQALMPMMQFSVAPWRVLDSTHLGIVRQAALLHARMGDYIYSLAQQAAKDGEPIVRHMEYAFPGEGFEGISNQYMLGDRYLVAPVVDKVATGTAAIRTLKLPKGNWVDDLNKKHKGGQTITIDVPLNRLVYFTRQ
ncbi:glycoside hydrolase [Fibrisoma montanum]|uniref:Glycoside hydrolase n=1 Tax=Fibrisoma montanum TaxID=2305895 RepID=A0A418M4T9_9BACT|nr:glycoside hydrolase family 31 protein [Fibrisoma montanum]RIV20740.1 glycoside hydrolase [Fibrisoma montanum]